MGLVALHPSELRSHVPEARKPWLIAAAALIPAVSAVLFVAAALLTDSSERAAEIKLGKIEDWPEIRNGVPEVMPPRAPADAGLASAGSGPRPAEQADPGAPAQELAQNGSSAREPPGTLAPERQAVAAPAAEAGSELVMRQLGEPAPPPPVEAALAQFRPAAAAGSSEVLPEAWRGSSAAPDPAPAALPAAAPDSAGEPSGAAAPLAPLPPRRPKDLAAEPRPKPAKVARAGAAPEGERKAGEAPGPAAPLPAAEAAPSAPADERVRVFGMALPAFVPNGRKIKDCVLELRC